MKIYRLIGVKACTDPEVCVWGGGGGGQGVQTHPPEKSQKYRVS